MSLKMPISLIFFTAIAIIIDCIAGYHFLLMTIMWLAPNSPLVYFSVLLLLIITFFVSIINIFRFRKWALITFVVFTLLFGSARLLLDILLAFRDAQYRDYVMPYRIAWVISLLLFIIYFARPSVRRLFK